MNCCRNKSSVLLSQSELTRRGSTTGYYILNRNSLPLPSRCVHPTLLDGICVALLFDCCIFLFIFFGLCLVSYVTYPFCIAPSVYLLYFIYACNYRLCVLLLDTLVLYVFGAIFKEIALVAYMTLSIFLCCYYAHCMYVFHIVNHCNCYAPCGSLIGQ